MQNVINFSGAHRNRDRYRNRVSSLHDDFDPDLDFDFDPP